LKQSYDKGGYSFKSIIATFSH